VVGSKTALIANFIQVPRMPKTAKKDYFLYVGRISDEKGVGTLVKAFGGLDEKLIIVGKGPVLRKLRAGAAHNVKFVGKKPRQTVLKYMSQAKALIVPSEVNEVFPTVILEAYACGTCVIAPARGVFKEMIKEGKTGILYRPGSVGELTRKIIEVDTHDRLRRMSKLAQKEALKYTREGYYDKLIKIYIRAPVT
jgi:glycosyltransferase involved in cell wall biosynthesis